MKNYMFGVLLSMTLFLCSCNGQGNVKIATSKKLIEYFEKQDSTKIIELIGGDLKSAGKSGSFISDECQKIKLLFEKYGQPSTKNFIIKDYSDNSLYSTMIIVPIFKGVDTSNNLLEARIEIFFAPDNILPATKIATYNLEQKFDLAKMKVVPLRLN